MQQKLFYSELNDECNYTQNWLLRKVWEGGRESVCLIQTYATFVFLAR